MDHERQPLMLSDLTMGADRYVVVEGEVTSHAGVDDPRAIQQQVLRVVAEVNDRFDETLIRPIEVYDGDRVIAILRDAADVAGVIGPLAEAFHPADTRWGVGAGTLLEPLRREARWAWGPARNAAAFALHHHRTPARLRTEELTPEEEAEVRPREILAPILPPDPLSDEDYVVLWGDMIASRQIANRAAAQRRLQEGRDAVNDGHAERLVLPAVILRGDGIVCVLAREADADPVIETIEACVAPVRMRWGIGVGPLHEPLPTDTRQILGPAADHARDAEQAAREAGVHVHVIDEERERGAGELGGRGR